MNQVFWNFFTFWLRQELRESLCVSVCLSSISLSEALNLNLSFIGLSQICLMSVSGQFQVSLRSLCAYFVRQTEPKILHLVKLVRGERHPKGYHESRIV